MPAVSPFEAALEGFRIPREQPLPVLAWAGLHLVVSAATVVAMITLGGAAFAEFMRMAQSRNPDLQAAVAQIRQLAPTYAVLLPLGLLWQSVFTGAIYRVVLRPTDTSFAYLRISGDELRLAGVIVIFIGFAALAVFGVTFVAAFATAIASATVGSQAAEVVGVVLAIGGIAFLFFLAVRFSLAPAQTFAERRLRLFDSWDLTKGHFWSLTLVYVVAGILALIVLLLASVLFSAAGAALHGGDVERAAHTFNVDVTSLETYFTPATVMSLAFNSVLSALYYALVFAPGAVIYRQLAQHGASDAFA